MVGSSQVKLLVALEKTSTQMLILTGRDNFKSKYTSGKSSATDIVIFILLVGSYKKENHS